MRANAPITAVLVLAALSFCPASLHARPHSAHKAAHAPTHKAAVATLAATKKHSRKKAEANAGPSPAPKHHATRRHHEKVEETQPVTITRIGHKKIGRKNRRGGSRMQTTQRLPEMQTPQKATSSDFLRAASAEPEADLVPQNQPERYIPTANFAAQKTLSSAPVPVVNIIRPAADRPSLPPVQEVVAAPVLIPSLYNKRGRLIVPPALKGSHEILLRQNQVADRDGLDRIRNDEEIVTLREERLLVPLPVGAMLVVDERLPANRRYCRPWTAQFLSTLSRAYYFRFHTPLQVNSAVRTVEFQQRLLRTNGNAAPAEGDTASPHLTGQAVDLAKHGLSLTQIAWLRGYLLPLVQEGKVDVEEEFQQACFHISVYKKYLPAAPGPRRSIASSHPAETATLAAAVN